MVNITNCYIWDLYVILSFYIIIYVLSFHIKS